MHFPQSICPHAALELSFDRISRETLRTSTESEISIMDVVVGSTSINGAALLNYNVLCIEVTDDSLWLEDRRPAIKINTKYDLNGCLYVLVGVVFSGNVKFGSVVVLDSTLSGDNGTYISPGVYFYNPFPNGRAALKKSLTSYDSSEYADELVLGIARQSLMRPHVFYYRRWFIDEAMPTFRWSLQPEKSLKMSLCDTSANSYGLRSVAVSREPQFVGDHTDCDDGTVHLSQFQTVKWSAQSCYLDSVLMILCHVMDTPWQTGDMQLMNRLSFHIFDLVGKYRHCLGKQSLIEEMTNIRNNIRETLYLLDSLLVKKYEQKWQPSSAVLVGAMLLRAIDHVRFPQRIAHNAQLDKSFEIIHKSTLCHVSGGSVCILDLFLGKAAAARQSRHIAHVHKGYVTFCVEISSKDLWNGYPSLDVPVKYVYGRGSYVLIGVILADDGHFSSMPVFFKPISADRGAMISPGVYYYDDMHSMVLQKQSLEVFQSSILMNDVLHEISKDTGMWPRFFYYRRDIVDENLDLCPWGEPESAAPTEVSAHPDVVILEKSTRKRKR